MSDRDEPDQPSTRKRWPRVVLGLLGLAVLYLAAWPVPIDPEPWIPPSPPELRGPYAKNDLLAGCDVLAPEARGPEDVAVDARGRLYAGLEDGRIVRTQPDGSGLTTFANTGGRPLGLAFDARGNLLVADGLKGLLSVDPQGRVEVLSTECDGLRFGFADDVDVARDGTVYFSDASSRFSVAEYKLDLLEHRGSGRLLAYDPNTKTTRLVLGGLYFANGVAVAPDQTSVLVTETGKYRVLRVWVRGPYRGTHQVIVDNLPGFPDGIASDGKGLFWMALASPRDAAVDGWLLPNPFLRKLLLRLPGFLVPQPQRHAFALAIDISGEVVHNLQDPSPGSFSPVTSVEPHGGYLYLGSLSHAGFGRIKVP